VTEMPGTTRDALEETIAHQGHLICLTDTAGIRRPTSKVESLGVELALRKAREADVTLYLVDSSRPLHGADADFINCNILRCNSLLVFSKTDLPQKISVAQKKKMAGAIPYCDVSAVCAEGLEQLKDRIISLVQKNLSTLHSSDMGVTANVRQSQLLVRTKEALEFAAAACQKKSSYELIAADVSGAMHFLNEITGEDATEELLGDIFSKFCIGK